MQIIHASFLYTGAAARTRFQYTSTRSRGQYSSAYRTVLLLVRTARVYECFLAVQYMADTAAVYTTVRVQQCDPISTSVAHTVRGKLV